MKKLILIALTFAFTGAYAQHAGNKTDAQLRTQVENEIKTKTPSPARLGSTLDSLIDNKVNKKDAKSGTVTSVALTVPNIFSLTGSPITVAGTLAVTLANQNANRVFAGPTEGGAAAPTFRALVLSDMPTLPASVITYTPSGDLTGNDVQESIDELEANKQNVLTFQDGVVESGGVVSLGGTLSGSVNISGDEHTISFSDVSGFAATLPTTGGIETSVNGFNFTHVGGAGFAAIDGSNDNILLEVSTGGGNGASINMESNKITTSTNDGTNIVNGFDDPEFGFQRKYTLGGYGESFLSLGASDAGGGFFLKANDTGGANTTETGLEAGGDYLYINAGDFQLRMQDGSGLDIKDVNNVDRLTIDESSGAINISAPALTLSSVPTTPSAGLWVANGIVYYGTTGNSNRVIPAAVSDETTAITTGLAKLTFRWPHHQFTITRIKASLNTAQTSGSIVTVNVKKNGTTVFSTKITIDNNETTSLTAASQSVLSTTTINEDDIVTVDIDQCDGATAATGLKLYFYGY